MENPGPVSYTHLDVYKRQQPPVQGALQNYVAHPADMCFKLPENVSTKAGALVEPLAVGLHLSLIHI